MGLLLGRTTATTTWINDSGDDNNNKNININL